MARPPATDRLARWALEGLPDSVARECERHRVIEDAEHSSEVIAHAALNANNFEGAAA